MARNLRELAHAAFITPCFVGWYALWLHVALLLVMTAGWFGLPDSLATAIALLALSLVVVLVLGQLERRRKLDLSGARRVALGGLSVTFAVVKLLEHVS